jgi:hypothetical protein
LVQFLGEAFGFLLSLPWVLARGKLPTYSHIAVAQLPCG